MNQVQQYQTIRARLIDPPVKLTREALQERDDKIASLKRTIRVHEQMQDQKQAIIDNLRQQIEIAAEAENRLVRELRKAKMTVATPPKGETAADIVVDDVLTQWPHLTKDHIKNNARKAADIVAARHSCIIALATRVPDMSYGEIARYLGVNQSTIKYAMTEGRLAKGEY